LAERHDSMMNPQIEGLLSQTGSKFRLVTLASQRARQINAYFGHLGDGLGSTIPPQVTSLARKPLSIAFEEIAEQKIVGVPASTYEGVEGDFAAGELAAGDYQGYGYDTTGNDDPTLAAEAAAREAVSQQVDVDAARDAAAAREAEEPGDVILEGDDEGAPIDGPGGDEA
jgi:DNA-directed RNA polymerase subunit omega